MPDELIPADTETTVPPPKSDGVSGLLDGINGKLATLGAIVTAIVGFNSTLTSCSNDTVNRYAAFRSAVTTEETFWKDRYSEYVQISAEQDKTLRKQKLFAIAALAQHPVPSFEEYSLGFFSSGTERIEAIKRLDAMRDTLKAALATDRTGDPEVAAAVQQAAAFERVQAETVQADTATAGSAEAPMSQGAVTKVVDASPNTLPQTLSLGKPTGWDIDLFWCAGGGPDNERNNYAIALDRARKLRDLASRGARLTPGVWLGRVRLRVLPELQQGGRYPALGSGNTLSIDPGNGEPEAAAAMLGFLNKSQPQFSQIASDAGSRYYISGYVCNASPTP